MTAHPAVTVRLRSGWLRWVASCPCGWRKKPFGGREAAELLADEHRRTGR